MHNQSTPGLSLIHGKVVKAQRVVIYGPEGIGKTTLAAAFPEPVFLDTEGGSAHLNVTRFPQPESWDAAKQAISQLAASEHDFQTLVIDTADWLERLLTLHVCRLADKDSIEDFGYGKGYIYLADEFSRFLQSLETLREHGMHLVMVAHSTIRKFEQPDAAGAYDRYELKLSKQCAPLIKEWCDLLLFVNYFTKVTDKDGKKRAVGGKERRIYTTHCAAFDAKNRHDLEDQLPMTFESIAHVFPVIEVTAHTPALLPSNQPCTELQIQNIQKLWRQLDYGVAEMTKLFEWLQIDAIAGAESWNDLTAEKAAKAIGFLAKKIQEKEVAQ